MHLSVKSCYVYLIFSQVIGLIAFLSGFYPVKYTSSKNASLEDLPTKIGQTRMEPHSLHYRHIDKMILMIVDGLRYDFLAGEENATNWPYTNTLLNNTEHCLLKVKVETPTVTMPRIKALMTGDVPGFLDVINNFMTSAVLEDNILRQASKHNLTSIFYGDETWYRLFPHDFKRVETTTSFYVNDFFEVDNNVTRNLDKELHSSNWDIMILHYLGLDHIGHAEGPKSSLIKPKLNEMDRIIEKIHGYIIQNSTDFEYKREKVVLVVCGDHGMRDSGGHGGSSLSETIVPFFFINLGCDTHLRNKEQNQIDFVPLITVNLGLPIPTSNIGKLDYRMIQNLPPLSRLYAMHYSTYRLVNNYEQNNGPIIGTLPDCLKHLKEAEDFFDKWMIHGLTNYENLSLHHYFEAQKLISETMIKFSAKFDFYLILISILLFIQIWLLLLKQCDFIFNTKMIPMFSLSYVILIFVNHVICFFSSTSSSMCSDIFDIFHPTPMANTLAIIISINVVFVKPLQRRIMVSLEDCRLTFPFLLHLLSYASSSYIEEEHQFWYFLFTTGCIYIIISRSAFSCIILLMVHRILQQWNQTGNKWASLYDIGDWLNEEQNSSFLLFTYFAGLFALIFWCSKNILGKHHLNGWKFQMEIIVFVFEIFILTIYRFPIRNLQFPFLTFLQTRGILEAKLFWVFLGFQVYFYCHSLDYRLHKRAFLLYLIDFILIIFLEIVAFLHKPHNVLLIPALLFFLDVLTKFFKRNIYHLIILYQSLGMIFFFYQGNSNSLGTVDVNSGFVGLEEFSIIFSGVFVFINTFSSIILSNILLLRLIYKEGRFHEEPEFLFSPVDIVDYDMLPNSVRNCEIHRCEEVQYYRVTAMFCCSYVIFYTIFITVQRHHLFIWTVFSPKLLYIGCEVVLYSLILLLSLSLEIFCFIIELFFLSYV